MVESVGYVKGKFRINAVVLRSFAHGALDIDNEISGCSFFAGDRLAAKADDISHAIFAKEFAVVLRNAGIVRQ